MVVTTTVTTKKGNIAYRKVQTTTSNSDPNLTIAALAAPVMAGLGIAFTPDVQDPNLTTTSVEVEVRCDCSNATAGDGVSGQLRFGTGAVPNNGDAATGTAVGSLHQVTSATAAARNMLIFKFILTGLVIGTTIWIDLSFSAVTGGVGHGASLFNVESTVTSV